MLSVKIYPVIRRAEPLMFDVYTYIGDRLVLVEMGSAALAQKRWMQAKIARSEAEVAA
jgi:hypothetical protein